MAYNNGPCTTLVDSGVTQPSHGRSLAKDLSYDRARDRELTPYSQQFPRSSATDLQGNTCHEHATEKLVLAFCFISYPSVTRRHHLHPSHWASDVVGKQLVQCRLKPESI
eukprot:3276081-Amphidinium_carterae.1